jgi:hypothetical protein
MQSHYLCRSLFGSTSISFVVAAVLLGTMVVGGAAVAQGPPSPQTGTTSDSPAVAEHEGVPVPLRELVQEAEQKNPQIAASFHAWQASQNVPQQAGAFPDTQALGAAV